MNKFAIFAALGALLLLGLGGACQLKPELPEPTQSADDRAPGDGITLYIGTVEIQKSPDSDIEPMRSGRGGQ